MKIDSEKLRNSIDSIEIDSHWFRRVFHTFAASFLIYYYIPDNFLLRFAIPSFIILIIFIFELLRIYSKIDRNYFYGLRIYETNRPASYLYFGVAVYLLLINFPQQIAIPCILCGCFTDPIVGEIRDLFGKNIGYIIAFFISMVFFIIVWFDSNLIILFSISIIGSISAVFGEAFNSRIFDDDFTIQIFPAISITVFLIILKIIQINISFKDIINPI